MNDLISSDPGSPVRASRRAERRTESWLAMAAQALLVVGAMVGMIAVPPASGRMLLLPLSGAGGQDGVARLALDAGARLVAAGPWRGSLVVSGDRGRLLAAMIPAHVLVVNANMGGCGERVGRSE